MKAFLLYALLVLTLLSVIFLPITVAADTATIVIRPGENWIAAPLVPYNPVPSSVFASCISVCTLTRFDVSSQQIVTYSTPKWQGSPGILLGDGYKIYNPTQSTFYCNYDGVSDGVPDQFGQMTDMWISLPGSNIDNVNAGGLHWIGHPFNHDVPISKTLLTNGSVVLTVAQAVNSGWINSLWTSFNAQTQMRFTSGLLSAGADDTYLRAGHMYEIQTHVDNLALIVPGALVPEPASVLALLTGVCSLGGFTWRKRK